MRHIDFVMLFTRADNGAAAGRRATHSLVERRRQR
jgi:hypothetical protein